MLLEINSHVLCIFLCITLFFKFIDHCSVTSSCTTPVTIYSVCSLVGGIYPTYVVSKFILNFLVKLN